MVLNVLELYCGIGGMHFALQRLEIPYKIVSAMEINENSLKTYRHNFPDANSTNRNILSVTLEELQKLEIHLILMSPPCQPFCRTGLKLDVCDPRTDSLQHLLTLIPQLKSLKFILVENVSGFEISAARHLLISSLQASNFNFNEFLLSPIDFGVPNSRLRYYLIGRNIQKSPHPSFSSLEKILNYQDFAKLSNMEKDSSPAAKVIKNEKEIWRRIREEKLGGKNTSNFENLDKFCIGDILENLDENEENLYIVPDKILKNYYNAMDIVDENCKSSCCFTKSYGTYIKGTGSVLRINPKNNKYGKNSENGENSWKNKEKLRFFTPGEVGKLMCFPQNFKFHPQATMKQKYGALGNSLNVFVVSALLALLLE